MPIEDSQKNDPDKDKIVIGQCSEPATYPEPEKPTWTYPFLAAENSDENTADEKSAQDEKKLHPEIPEYGAMPEPGKPGQENALAVGDKDHDDGQSPENIQTMDALGAKIWLLHRARMFVIAAWQWQAR
jgi:hypothetical protein